MVKEEVCCKLQLYKMIITKTPFRMSFFGGGTDINDYFKKNEGAVISTTIDKFCYVNVRHLPRFFSYSNELVYSKIERVSDITEIEHPTIREAMRYLDMHEIRLTYEADLPARSGLGTSSSFAVGMLNAFYSLKGKYVSKRKLAEDAIYLERVLCNEKGGWQDQIAASFGGLNRINFKDEQFEVLPIIISPERKRKLNNNLMLFFTGFTRFSSLIQENNNFSAGRTIENLHHMYSLVNDAEKILISPTLCIDDFGNLLNEEWQVKRKLNSSISTTLIDEIYQRGLRAGALGGKLLGAGGGGFIVFYVQEEKHNAVREALKDLLYIPFEFENNGTQVIYYSPEDYTPVS